VVVDVDDREPGTLDAGDPGVQHGLRMEVAQQERWAPLRIPD
jgi:hypothetical protein